MRGAVYDWGAGGRGRGRYRDDDEVDGWRAVRRHGALRSNASSSPVPNLDVGAETSASSEEGELSLEDGGDHWAEDSGNCRSGSRGSGATAGSDEMEDAGEPGAALGGAESDAESRSCIGAGLGYGE